MEHDNVFYHATRKTNLETVLLFLSLCFTISFTIWSAALSDQNLFPFGLSEGDMTVPRSLFGTSSRIELCTPFPFFGTLETALYVSYIYYCVERNAVER